MNNQSELSALVVRSIGDVEAAMNYAIEVLSPLLWRSAGERLLEACPDTWFARSDPADDDVLFADRAWLVPGADPAQPDFWLSLEQRIKAGGEDDTSWLATFTASGPHESSLVFYVGQDIIKPTAWKKLLKANVDLLAKLNSLGFDFDEDDDRRLCLPVRIDTELLAEGLEEGDLTKAMQPLTDAVGKAVSAATELNQLRTLARGLA